MVTLQRSVRHTVVDMGDSFLIIMIQISENYVYIFFILQLFFIVVIIQLLLLLNSIHVFIP